MGISSLTPRAITLTIVVMTATLAERRVVFVVYPGFQSLDLAGPFEVFSGVNDLLAAERRAAPRYRPIIAAETSGPVASESGLAVVAESELRRIRGALDTLVVVGGRAAARTDVNAVLVGHVQRLASKARRITSVCSGSFILARAGLLGGRTACTHWARADQFEDHFPQVHLDRDSLHRKDGNVWTSAGVTAGIDLALALVAEDHGDDLAQTVARWLVMFYRRPGGQSQFAAPVWHGVSERDVIKNAQHAILQTPGADHRLNVLAEAAAMSERNFLRVFARDVGVSPAKFVESARLNAACQMLETTDATVETIAHTTGFGTAETMRRTFQRARGVAPSDYRRRFARHAS